MTSQGLMSERNAAISMVITRENFDTGHFELFNFSGIPRGHQAL
jgi:hypothetical protein